MHMKMKYTGDGEVDNVVGEFTKDFYDHEVYRHVEGDDIIYRFGTGKQLVTVHSDGIIECHDANFGIRLSFRDDFEETDESKTEYQRQVEAANQSSD